VILEGVIGREAHLVSGGGCARGNGWQLGLNRYGKAWRKGGDLCTRILKEIGNRGKWLLQVREGGCVVCMKGWDYQ